MSVVVAEEGNRRRGEMTLEEAEQCIVDIKSWFIRAGGDSLRNISGVSQADLQRLEKTFERRLPLELKTLFLEIDGDIYYMEKRLMSCQTITETLTNLERSRQWKLGCIPLFGDESGMICFDSESGNVCEWDVDDGFGDLLSPSLSSFFESYRNLLCSGHCEFVRDIGVVETLTRPKK